MVANATIVAGSMNMDIRNIISYIVIVLGIIIIIAVLLKVLGVI